MSVVVSTGPDAGQTFTATTNSTGIATITINTSSVGTNVYTATATVNGVAKTVSTTVTWSATPTTTVAPTTTTEAPATTTTETPATTTEPTPTTTDAHQGHVMPTTAPITEPTSSIPEITSLPVTGSDTDNSGIIAFAILASGFAIYLLAKKIK